MEIKTITLFDIIKVKPDTPKTNIEIFTIFELDVVKFLTRRTELVLLTSHFFYCSPWGSSDYMYTSNGIGFCLFGGIWNKKLIKKLDWKVTTFTLL